MTVALTCNELKFKSKALATATTAIIKARNSAVSSYLTIGEKLMEIRDKKLYREDFANFEDFTVEIFGLSKATAYRMIAVTTRFLIPEKTATTESKFFSDFEDSALGALLSAPLPEETADTYKATKEFCDEYAIDTTTSVAEIRKIIKDAKEKTSESLNVETGTAEETETTDSTKDNEVTILTLSDVQRDNVMNIADAILSYVSTIRANVERDNTITQCGYDVLSEMFKALK